MYMTQGYLMQYTRSALAVEHQYSSFAANPRTKGSGPFEQSIV